MVPAFVVRKGTSSKQDMRICDWFLGNLHTLFCYFISLYIVEVVYYPINQEGIL